MFRTLVFLSWQQLADVVSLSTCISVDPDAFDSVFEASSEESSGLSKHVVVM